MTHYARLENSVIVEFFETDEDITTLFPPELIWVEAPLEAKQGWSCINEVFSPPTVQLPPEWRVDVWNQFRVKRDLYLARLSDIAGRYQRKGDTAVPPAADAIAEGLLAMPEDPNFNSAASPDDLRSAIVVAANILLRAQLTNPATAVSIKTALDKVFK